VAKEWAWGGVIGTLEDLAQDVLFGGVAGFALGAVIGLTREAIGWLGARLGAGGTIGVVAGVVVFGVAALAGAPLGTAVLMAVVAGVAAGAVTEALINQRPLNDTEINYARRVFGDTIPYDKVWITNLGGLNNRAFTAPGVDGKTYVNLGYAWPDPLGRYPTPYPHAGQVLIHELTHAWQIAHTGFLPGLMCSGIVNQVEYTFGDNVYDYGAPGLPWADFNLEQQGAIVDQWFGGSHHSSDYLPMSRQNPYYQSGSG
jgi:hypothetical protein